MARKIKITKRDAKKTKEIVVKNERTGDIENTFFPNKVTVGLEDLSSEVKVHGDVESTGTISTKRLIVDGQAIDGASTAGATFAFSVPVIPIDADEDFGDPTNGGDWETDFDNTATTTLDASTGAGDVIQTTGYDYSHPTQGGDDNLITSGRTKLFLIDSLNISATSNGTPEGTPLTVELEGENDLTPTQFNVNLKNGTHRVTTLKIERLESTGRLKISVIELSKYEDATSNTIFSGLTIDIPFKVNLGTSVFTLTRTLRIQKIKTGTTGDKGETGAKGNDGPIGDNARAVHLKVSSGKNFIIYDSKGANPTPNSITLQAEAQNTESTPYFTFFLNDNTVVHGPETKGFFTFTPPASLDDEDLPLKFEVELREGTDKGAAVALDQHTIPGVRNGGDAYTVSFVNPTHVIPADEDGLVEDPDGEGVLKGYEGSGVEIFVLRGATLLTPIARGGTPTEGQFEVTPQLQQGTITIGDETVDTENSKIIIGDHSGFDTNSALISYNINAENEVVLTQLQSLGKSRRGIKGIEGAKGNTGSDGTAARSVKLTATDQAIIYDANGANPTPDGVDNRSSGGTDQRIRIFATPTNHDTTATLHYSFYINDGDGKGGSSPVSEGTNDFFYYTPQSSYDNMPDSVEVEFREGDGSAPILARDEMTIFGLKPGESGYSVILSNESHTIPSEFDGDVPADSYSGSGTKIDVFRGITRLVAADFVNAGSGYYRVSASGTDITPSTPTRDGGTTVYGDHKGFKGGDTKTAQITYTIVADEIDGSGQEIEKKQTFSKSFAGEKGQEGSKGTDGKSVKLSLNTSQGIKYNTQGLSPTPNGSVSEPITLTATRFGPPLFGGTQVYYAFIKDNDEANPVQNSTSPTYSYTPPANFNSMPDQFEVFMREGSSTGPIVATDQLTIFGLRPGEDSYSMILTNEAHTLATNIAGTVTYTGSGTTVRVFRGTTELTARPSNPDENQFTVLAKGTNIKPRNSTKGINVTPSSNTTKGAVYNDHGSMTQNQATIEYTATTGGGGPTLVKVQTLSKSIEGAKGGKGSKGSKGFKGATGADGVAAGITVIMENPQVIIPVDGHHARSATYDLKGLTASTISVRLQDGNGTSMAQYVSKGVGDLDDGEFTVTNGSIKSSGYAPSIAEFSEGEKGEQVILDGVDLLSNPHAFRSADVFVRKEGVTYEFIETQQIVEVPATFHHVSIRQSKPVAFVNRNNYFTNMFSSTTPMFTAVESATTNDINFRINEANQPYDSKGALGTWKLPDDAATNSAYYTSRLEDDKGAPYAIIEYPDDGSYHALNMKLSKGGFESDKSNDTNSAYPVPERVVMPIKYTDPGGTVHTYRFTQVVVPRVRYPVKRYAPLYIEIDFSKNDVDWNPKRFPQTSGALKGEAGDKGRTTDKTIVDIVMRGSENRGHLASNAGHRLTGFATGLKTNDSTIQKGLARFQNVNMGTLHMEQGGFFSPGRNPYGVRFTGRARGYAGGVGLQWGEEYGGQGATGIMVSDDLKKFSIAVDIHRVGTRTNQNSTSACVGSLIFGNIGHYWSRFTEGEDPSGVPGQSNYIYGLAKNVSTDPKQNLAFFSMDATQRLMAVVHIAPGEPPDITSSSTADRRTPSVGSFNWFPYGGVIKLYAELEYIHMTEIDPDNHFE